MTTKRIINFKISDIDGLGQGVSKVSDKITFIPKTAVGEEGVALILNEKKGVAFARMVELEKISPLRIKPLCPHFNDCPSCHYLHVPYEHELECKKQNLIRILRKVTQKEIKVIGAKRRLSYRNRIQLHYDLQAEKLGMLDAKRGEIIPVPLCEIARPEVQKEVQRLYEDQSWLKEAPAKPLKGHLEIYQRKDGMRLSWNRPYAEGGFSQVFEEMNRLLREVLKTWQQHLSSGDLIDLFAGTGNLSQDLPYHNRLCVDWYSALPSGDFMSLNLYEKGAPEKVQEEIARRQIQSENLILDPPRSGLKNMHEWLATLNPQAVAYVSCDPHTLARDLLTVADDYEVEDAYLIDFFPSTFHFETLVTLKRK